MWRLQRSSLSLSSFPPSHIHDTSSLMGISHTHTHSTHTHIAPKSPSSIHAATIYNACCHRFSHGADLHRPRHYPYGRCHHPRCPVHGCEVCPCQNSPSILLRLQPGKDFPILPISMPSLQEERHGHTHTHTHTHMHITHISLHSIPCVSGRTSTTIPTPRALRPALSLGTPSTPPSSPPCLLAPRKRPLLLPSWLLR